jgi:hypothetical protein
MVNLRQRLDENHFIDSFIIFKMDRFVLNGFNKATCLKRPSGESFMCFVFYFHKKLNINYDIFRLVILNKVDPIYICYQYRSTFNLVRLKHPLKLI